MDVERYQSPRLPLHLTKEVTASTIKTPSLRVRLAEAILDLAECAEIDVANSIFVTCAISNDRLAVLAGGKSKSVARMVEQFKLRGLVEMRRERFIIRAPERLRKIVSKAT